jgi:hypothetical protein
MFSFLGKETCPVQLYGKLPLAKDYLRLGAGQGAGQALRDWLDRAFSQGANAKDPLVLPWPTALLIGESWGGTLCGAAWPSGDAGNLRPFPFVAFVERRKKGLLEDLDAGLPLSATVWDNLRQVYDAREKHDDGQAFLAAMRGRELELEELKPAAAEPISFERWLAALYPTDGDAGLLATFKALDALRRASYRGPLRLPLVTNLPPRPQVHAWFKLLGELNLIARDNLTTLLFPLPEPTPVTPSQEAPATVESPEFPAFGADTSGGSEAAPAISEFPSFDATPSSDAPAQPQVPPAEDAPVSEPAPEPAPSIAPHFMLVFRATPAPTDAVWLRAPAERAPRRDGDLCAASGAVADQSSPEPENVPPLADSLRGALARMRGKLAR